MSLDVPAGESYGAPREPGRAGSGRPGSPYETPLRHHQRKPSTPRQVKETLHARSEWSNSGDDGAAVHKINQYIIGEEIGRGSFGSVHLATDQFGREYAVKEFSKSRLRKRAQSNILRRPHGPGRGFFSPQNSRFGSRASAASISDNPLDLIKEEIAIMKKLNHPNLVSLLEVLDDPDEDSLYMVLEMCKKGVIMKVGMHEPADPYDSESCRCWFRDLILGIEYLHAQGVAHRDIKPDNLLLNDDDELKIVDFGVSEMFEKTSDLLSAKSAGSPAFLPPELCVTKHGNVSGRAADIWSMGVTLYCLYFGRVPFEKTNILELYESIRDDPVLVSDGVDPSFRDLIYGLLEKDPEKRIKMAELRAHPWVTKDGADLLMSESDNVTTLVEPPTETELQGAITKNMGNLMAVAKAVKKFKGLLPHRQAAAMEGILGPASQLVAPPQQIGETSGTSRHVTSAKQVLGSVIDTKLGALSNAKDPSEVVAAAAALSADNHPVMSSPDAISPTGVPLPNSPFVPQHQSSFSGPNPPSRPGSRPQLHRVGTPHEGRGQAHDPLTDTVYLGVGAHGSEEGTSSSFSSSGADPMGEELMPAISESPSADDTNIYELAYQAEIDRIRRERGRNATVYLTRRVEQVHQHLKDQARNAWAAGPRSATFSGGEGASAFETIARRAKDAAGQKSRDLVSNQAEKLLDSGAIGRFEAKTRELAEKGRKKAE